VRSRGLERDVEVPEAWRDRSLTLALPYYLGPELRVTVDGVEAPPLDRESTTCAFRIPASPAARRHLVIAGVHGHFFDARIQARPALSATERGDPAYVTRSTINRWSTSLSLGLLAMVTFLSAASWVLDRQRRADFGLAGLDARAPIDAEGATAAPQLTHHGAFLGTPAYMAPELARGAAHASAASDVFALGVLAHELLTGKAPWPEPRHEAPGRHRRPRRDRPRPRRGSGAEDASSALVDAERELDAAELRQLDLAVTVRRSHHRDVDLEAFKPDDAVHPGSLDGHLGLHRQPELGGEGDRSREIVDYSPDVVHSSKRHAPRKP